MFINRKLTENQPLMANAVYGEQGEMQTIIMIWSIPWESMTLGMANQLVVISALIHTAVSRANRYLAALEEERYVDGSRMMTRSWRLYMRIWEQRREDSRTVRCCGSQD